MNKKARAFGGWVQNTTSRLIAFRGWADSYFFKPAFPPTQVQSSIESLNINSISKILSSNIRGFSDIENINIKTEGRVSKASRDNRIIFKES